MENYGEDGMLNTEEEFSGENFNTNYDDQPDDMFDNQEPSTDDFFGGDDSQQEQPPQQSQEEDFFGDTDDTFEKKKEEFNQINYIENQERAKRQEERLKIVAEIRNQIRERIDSADEKELVEKRKLADEAEEYKKRLGEERDEKLKIRSKTNRSEEVSFKESLESGVSDNVWEDVWKYCNMGDNVSKQNVRGTQRMKEVLIRMKHTS